MASETTCCCSLKDGSRIVAIIFIVGSSLTAVASLVFTILFAQAVHRSGFFAYQIILAIFVVILIIAIVYIILNIILLGAANNNDYRKARTWMIGTIILFTIRIILLVPMFLTPSTTTLVSILIEVIALIFNVYAFWVVARFMNELKKSGGNGEGARLT